MARYPWAENHNINPGPQDPPITPRIIVLHTMVGTMVGSEARFRDGSGVEAHFGVSTAGNVWQWRDTARQADAQGSGNDYCISIETEDKGDPSIPWTATQLIAIINLIRWLSDVHTIPFKLVTTPSGRGIGYHRQFPEWNPNKHSCPGDVRLDQLIHSVIPALPIDGATMTDAQLQAILTKLEQLHTDNGTLMHSDHHHNFVELNAAVADLLGQVIIRLDEIKELLISPREPT